MKRKYIEHQMQCNIITWANAMSAIYDELKWLHSSLNGARIDWKTATQQKRAGMKRGIFDLFLPVKNSKYSGYYIEMKTGYNKLTPYQKSFKKFVESQGFKADVFYSDWEAIEGIKKYLGVFQK